MRCSSRDVVLVQTVSRGGCKWEKTGKKCPECADLLVIFLNQQSTSE